MAHKDLHTFHLNVNFSEGESDTLNFSAESFADGSQHLKKPEADDSSFSPIQNQWKKVHICMANVHDNRIYNAYFGRVPSVPSATLLSSTTLLLLLRLAG